ncbi:alpha-L-rhamnosidase-related protein [Paenibacillus sp. WC2504]|uniref:alpha-L-rhamnosidase-related protein n=1 Tax=Paenibacillus sp. WC2504 TaxID=3461403 RepID=UPI0040456BF2
MKISKKLNLLTSVLVFLSILGLSGHTASAQTTQTMQTNLWPSNPNWQKYVQAPTSRDVHPVKVVSISGDVTNPQALVNSGTGVTTLTMLPGGPNPTIIMDYGKDVGGVPKFQVTAATGSPTLQAGYSESEKFISPTGDGGSPWASGDPKRYDTYTITGPGTVTNQYIQGGQRYEEITLTSPGSVSLSSVGIYFEPYLANANDYKGYFISSSDQLNRIWYAGAYTAQLNQVRPGTAEPPIWTIEDNTLTTGGTSAGPGYLKIGSNWSDYRVSFRTAIDQNQSGWVLRAAPESYYLFILNASNDTVGTPNTLQQVVYTSTGYQVIGNVQMPYSLTPGVYYDVESVVQGNTVTTYINGQKVASFDTTTLPSGMPNLQTGTFGFREFSGEKAKFKDLKVTDLAGAVLYENSFGDSSALNDFSIPNNNGENTLSLLVDGAKRDRAIWSGDLSTLGPTVFVTTAANEYMRDSLELFGSYQGANGYLPGAIAPQVPLHTGPLNSTTMYAYSASYSMYFVRDLAEYYLYTGDKTFLEQEWPVVQRELAWSASQVNNQGLFITDQSNGNDWDYYDGPKKGGVTAFNALYYQTLLDGASMAKALGHTELAEQYTDQAATLKKAINTNLFNPTTGVYDVSTEIRGTIGQDANAFAILFDIAPKNHVPEMLETMKKTLWTAQGPHPFSSNTGLSNIISPYVSGFELLARLSVNDTDNAMRLLNSMWVQMVVEGPYYTGALWENVGVSGEPTADTSLAHGWATTPTFALSQYVLGVGPVDPGYKTWIVQPHSGNLEWAEGQVPTEYGPLSVKWGQDSSSHQFVMNVQSPVGTTGTIAVPVSGSNSIIHMNGKLIWYNGHLQSDAGVKDASTDGKYVYLNGVAVGEYQIESQVSDNNDEEQTMLVGPSTVTSGQSFDVTYQLSGVTESVYAQDLTLTYDPAQMEFLSADSLLTNLEIVAISDVSTNPGKIRILSAIIGGDHSASGNLLVFHMRAKSSSSAPATLTLSDVVFANGKGAEKNIAGTAYSVQIAGPINKDTLVALITDAQTKHDTATEGTHPGQYPVGAKATLQAAINKAQSIVNNASTTQQQLEQATSDLTSALQLFISSILVSTPGDLNGDNRISIGDLAIIASYYGKMSTDPNWNMYKKSDINNDGVIDILDLAALAKWIIG